MGTRSVASASRRRRTSPGDDMDGRGSSLGVPSRLPSLRGGIDTLDFPLNRNPVTVKREPEPSTEEERIPSDARERTSHVKAERFEDPVTVRKAPESSAEEASSPPDPRKSFQYPVAIKREAEPSTEEEWIPSDPREGTPRMKDKSVQTPLTIKKEPESIEEEWAPPDLRKSFPNPAAIKKGAEGKRSGTHRSHNTLRVKGEAFEHPVAVKREPESPTEEERRASPDPRGSSSRVKVECFEAPVTVKKEPEPSAEEEWVSAEPGESSLFMEVVEESFEDAAPPAQGDDSKEKRERGANEEEAFGGSQGAIFISPEGTYLPKAPFPGGGGGGGSPGGSTRRLPQVSEFERIFLEQLCRNKDEEKGPAGEESAHRCPECGKTFPFSGRLKLHQKFHVKEKPFGCPECGRRFALQAHLQSHQRMHSGERPFRCEECGQRFSYSWAHKKHQKFHEARRGFAEPRAASSRIGAKTGSEESRGGGTATQGPGPAAHPDTSKPAEAVEFAQLSTLPWSQQGFSSWE